MTVLGPGDIVGLVNSTYATDLFVAVVTEFDIFTRLAEREATTARQLSEMLEIDERGADVTLTYLAALGLLERLPGGAVRVAEPAARYLQADSSIDLRHYARTVSTRPGCREVGQVLRTGQPAPWESDGDDWINRMSEKEFADSFAAAMNARGAYLSPALGEVLSAIGVVSRILDIGGSSGIYACSLVQALPGTTAAVLDLPSVVDFTRESIAARGLSDRVDAIGGDMFGELPSGFDLHLYSNVWHDWDAESIGKFAAASFAALPPGGVLVDHDMHLDDTKSGPLRQAEFSVRMMLKTAGKCYSTPELAEILGPIGFEDVHLRPTTAGYSALVARKPA
ncbi:acetylserotonin O-methyltransferase [Kibdelosporangium philippinense]|uniref:Acetylserotonin O-methyltransferase n=1 Tax=Kibdelosporangium philippinense TaxID=211113 RepID=A0ABS8ZP54_9PSEU|nr:acetylserotonin O-methyltransferase [Kibdelosporangium philippinense]MCE7009500.1 acetylserotonin O-methyltransferase [Kibdelosporangium philippinense]